MASKKANPTGGFSTSCQFRSTRARYLVNITREARVVAKTCGSRLNFFSKSAPTAAVPSIYFSISTNAPNQNLKKANQSVNMNKFARSGATNLKATQTGNY